MAPWAMQSDRRAFVRGRLGGGKSILSAPCQPRKPLLARWSTLTLYVALILATLPVMPLLWVPIRQRFGRPATFGLSTLVALGGAWVSLKILAVGQNRSAVRGLFLGGSVVLFVFFLWYLDNPVEKVHFLEYGFLSYLAFHCLRSSRGGLGIWGLRAATLALTAAVGTLDEVIQYLLPNRFGELRDVAFNALAGLLGLVGTELLEDGGRRKEDDESPR